MDFSQLIDLVQVPEITRDRSKKTAAGQLTLANAFLKQANESLQTLRNQPDQPLVISITIDADLTPENTDGLLKHIRSSGKCAAQIVRRNDNTRIVFIGELAEVEKKVARHDSKTKEA